MTASAASTIVKVTPVKTQVTSLGTTDSPPDIGRHTTDIIYQEVRLYIEGVQVPFEAISVSQAFGKLPEATIQVPPQSGLMDIARYYESKVHVFYEDLNYGGLRLLFWGHIIDASFMHSRAGSGSASIRFAARHKNNMLKQVTLDYCGYTNPGAPGQAGDNSNLVVNGLNSQQGIIDALKGITGVQSQAKDLIEPTNKSVSDADSTKLMVSHSELAPRYKGMASVSMNFWNQLKKAVYRTPQYNTVMAGMLIPLVEDGIGYFKRTTGHTYIESILDGEKQQICPHVGVTADIVVPPAMKAGLISAVTAKLSVGAASNALQFSGELTDFGSLLEEFYYSVGYEIITLASPSEVPVDPSVNAPDYRPSKSPVMAVETIIKPQLPFYYAPVCNVIMPRMFHSIQVTQDERDTPSRCSAVHDASSPDATNSGTTFRGPHTVREAVAYAASVSADGSSSGEPTLLSTMGLSYNAPGRYEQGRGIKPTKVALPWWLQSLSTDESNKTTEADPGELPVKGTTQYDDSLRLAAAWRARNGYDITERGGEINMKRNAQKDLLNPYSPSSKILPYQRVMFSSVDYIFTEAMTRSRTGVVECTFNPYIIPGYPMDVLDDSPNHPCFHAVCSSVTHSISARSISTTVGMIAVQTYAELSNYYTPPAPPWFQTALNLVSTTGSGGSEYGNTDGITVKNAGNLLSNPEGKATADKYYHSTLGVAAADPTTLIDWTTGQVFPQSRLNGCLIVNTKDKLPTPNGGDANDYNTGVGNLRLVSRPIESKESISFKFDYDFVDLTPENYNTTTRASPNPALERDRLLEPGASPFLEYMESKDFIQVIKDATHGITTELNVNGATPDNAVPRWRKL